MPVFTPEEVENMNDFQKNTWTHSFTCQCNGSVDLVATEEGWVCPAGCGYTQNWAHTFMKDGSWRKFMVNPFGIRQPDTDTKTTERTD